MGGQHTLPEIITECAVTDCTVQPDGRLSVQCTGLHRVHVDSISEQDGYRVVTVDEEVSDEPPVPRGRVPQQLKV
jgi:Lon protease-like protein